jgi:hypothetical protein
MFATFNFTLRNGADGQDRKRDEDLRGVAILHVYYNDSNRTLNTPPPPLSIGIMGLGGNSRKIFEFKGLIAKIFINQ